MLNHSALVHIPACGARARQDYLRCPSNISARRAPAFARHVNIANRSEHENVAAGVALLCLVAIIASSSPNIVLP